MGWVQDASTRAPVEGLEVFATLDGDLDGARAGLARRDRDLRPHLPRVALTDANGFYQVSGLAAPAEAILEFWHADFEPQRLELDITSPGTVFEHNLSLSPASYAEIRLVDEESEEAIAGASVMATLSEAVALLPFLRASVPFHLTDEDGRLRVRVEKGAQLEVKTFHPHYDWAVRRLDIEKEGFSAFEIALTKASHLTGVVLAPTGEPFIAGGVSVAVAGHEEAAWNSGLDPEGRFDIIGLRPGEAVVSVLSVSGAVLGRFELHLEPGRQDVELGLPAAVTGSRGDRR